MQHISVLLDESIAGLKLNESMVAIDGTVGQGGHASKIAQAIGRDGTLIMIDADESSLASARERLSSASAHLIYVQGNFRHIREHAQRSGVTTADAIILDLGWHSGQLMSGRGFSFNEDAPLLMTLAQKPEAHQITAADIIAGYNEDDLAALFKNYGEERFSGRIARTIVEERHKAPITNSLQLANIIVSAVPAKFKKGRIHPATRVFQALRIAVNDEFEALKDGIRGSLELLAPGGRLAIITFHSLEDRIVKLAFAEAEKAGSGIRVTKKPIVPGRKEQVENPRARSAKLRIFEKHA